MHILEFVRNWSDIYYADKEKLQAKSKIYWTFVLLLFTANVCLQLYGLYLSRNDLIFDSYRFRSRQSTALIYQTVILIGFLIKYISLQYRSRFALKLGEVGELIAFSSCLGHRILTIQIHNESFYGQGSYFEPLIGISPHIGSLILGCFSVWVIYKILWIIAVMWKTIRK